MASCSRYWKQRATRSGPWTRPSGGGSTHCWSCCQSSRRSWPRHLSTSPSRHGEALGGLKSFRTQGAFMPVTAAQRYQDPDDEAKLLLGFIAVAAVAGVGYICYARLHIRKEQLMEASLYLLAAFFVFWDSLRYRSEERRVGKECRYRWSPY